MSWPDPSPSSFIFHEDGTDLLDPLMGESFGMVGPFHVAPLIRQLAGLANYRNHLLLAGPSGSGKELAALAFAALAGREILVHNAARYGSEVLFIDEAHNLPKRLQKRIVDSMVLVLGSEAGPATRTLVKLSAAKLKSDTDAMVAADAAHLDEIAGDGNRSNRMYEEYSVIFI